MRDKSIRQSFSTNANCCQPRIPMRSTMMTHPAALPVDELLSQCRTRTERRSGPGGQHRNKVETAVVISHEPTGVAAEASERRSQAENRRVAIERLRLRLALEHRQTVDESTTPSELWKSRTSGRSMRVSTSHPDFPSLLAEALDRLDAFEFDIRQTADYFALTSSQFVKFLRSCPAALTRVNQQRSARGMHKLK